MLTEEVAKNIYRIPVVLPDNPLKYLNSYLIKGSDRYLLIDTGFRLEACREALFAGLAELDTAPEDVDIFLTHMHADHTGLAADIIGKDREIIMGEIDREWLVDLTTSKAKWERNIAKYLTSGMPSDTIGTMPTLSPVRIAAPRLSYEYIGLKNGHVVSVGGYDLQCVQVPGHTPGHMCLWDEKHGLMFTGDHVLFDITPNITVWGNLDDALGLYLDSLEAVKQYPVQLALPGHRMSGDFASRIDALIVHHERRLDGILKIIADAPGLPGADIASRMKWNIRATSWEDFPETQKIFAIGECLSHLEYLQRRERVKVDKVGEVNYFYPA